MVWKRLTPCLIVLTLLLSLLPGSFAAAAPYYAKIEPELVRRLTPNGRVDYVVRFAEQADLSLAHSMTWAEKGPFVYQTLQETAARSQTSAWAYLQDHRLAYESFIAGNELYVRAGDLASVYALAALPEVASLRVARVYYLDPSLAVPLEPLPQATTDWGIIDTRADDFWAAFGMQGQGIVVANIDTGVQWDHPALVDQFRCPGNPADPACWRDPSNICGGSMCDNNGHGTHTMGTMVAADDPALTYIAGMAPGAQWIACKGCETNSCSEAALNACADWILAPDGDPANRPHVVNNSWGGGGNNSWYLPKVQAWRAAGIFPAFSAGNAGSGCNTLGSPGDYQESMGSAAHDSSRNVASFSSRGPSAFGHDPYTKPNISAPGVNICSSVPGNGWNCTYSGTSMASPHTAGAVALLWSCNPALIGQINQTFQILQGSADTPPAGNCGAPPDAQGNYTYGYGYLNIYNAGASWCGDVGSLAGLVRHAGAPIQDALVVATAANGSTFSDRTDSSGYYTMTMLAGPYTVTASAYGYLPQTVSGVDVLPDTITTLNFDLLAAPEYVISGTVTEAGSGVPLSGQVTVLGTPIPPAQTDPATGFYSVTAPVGVYTVQAEAPRHRPVERQVVVDHDQTQNFSLLTLPCILLVDDDQNYRADVRSYYTSALDALGYGYDLWDVATQGSPGTADLMGYRIVLWFLGASYQDTLNGANEATVAAYLDSGGNFVLFGQDYLYDRQISPFGQNYLGITSYTDDIIETDAVGNTGNPIGDGLGPYYLVTPPGWMVIWSDYVDGVQGSPFRWQASGQNSSTNYEGAGFKTAFFSWPLAGITDVADRATLLDAIFNWFGGCAQTGTLTGQVTHEYYGLPIAGATVTAAPGQPADAGVLATTDPNGYYTLTLPTGVYDVTAQKDGFTSETVTGVVVITNGVTTQDLVLNSPVILATPPSLHAYVNANGLSTLTLAISDVGALDLSFEIREATQTMRLESAGVPPAAGETSVRRVDLALSGLPGPQGASSSWTPAGPVALVVDDGQAEDSIGLTSGGQFLWLNRFTPNPDDFPFNLTQLSLLFNTSVTVGDQMQLVIWEDTDGDGDPGTGATFLYAETVSVQHNDLVTWNVYDLAGPVPLNGPGDVLVGVVNRSGIPGYLDYPAAIDTTASQGRSWVGGYSVGDPPDPPTLPADALWTIIDATGHAGNWALRGSGFTRVVDVPWVSEAPTTSVVPAGAGLGVDVVFSAQAPYDVPGDYTAFLVVYHNDPMVGNVVIPVTMTVAACIPVHDPSFTWSPPTPVVDEPVTLTATVAGDEPITYDWDLGDGTVGSGIVLTHSYGLPGVYTVTMTATNCSGQASVSVVQTITVAASCVPVSDADFAWSPLPPTVGDTVYFTATATGTLPITYEWDLGDGTTATGANVSHAYAVEGDYTVVMTATNCDGQSSVSVSHLVTVIPVGCAPVAGADWSWSPTIPAVGDTVHFTGTATGTLPIAFDWTFGDGSIGAGANPTHIYTQGGAYTVTMTATNCGGLYSATVAYPVTVVCDGIDSIDFSWTPADPMVGEAVDFTASVTGGTAPFSYAWNFGDGGVGSGLTATHSYTASGIYTVALTVTDACGELSLSLPVTVGEGQVEWTVFLPIVFKSSVP